MPLPPLQHWTWQGEEGIFAVGYRQQPGEGKGAPVNIYNAGDEIPKTNRDKSNKDRLSNGNYLENTANHYIVVLGKNPTTALLSMKATQLKTSKKWNSMMLGIKMQGKMAYSHRQHIATFIS